MNAAAPTSQVRVFDKAASLGRVVVLGKVGQRAVLEPERAPLALDNLLPDTGRHLRNVDERALGAGDDHLLDVVVGLEGAFGTPSGRVTGLVERARDFRLERLADRHPRFGFEPVVLRHRDDPLDLALGRVDEARDRLHRALVRDRVADPDREAVVEQPKVDRLLHAREPIAAHLVALFAVDDVDQPTLRRADRLLVDGAKHDLAVLDKHAVVLGRVDRVGRRTAVQVDPGRDAHRQDLLARPERFRLHDGRRRDHAVPLGDPQEDVLDKVEVHEAVAEGKLADAAQRVLDDTHDGLVGLRRDDVARDGANVDQLGAGLFRLRHVQVHLVAVKVGVVRRRDRQVEPEGRVRHELDAVRHHRHLVQRRLPVEQDNVAVLEVALDDPPVLEERVGALVVPQVDPVARVADDVPRAGVLVRSVPDQFLEVLDVVRRDALRVGQSPRDRERDADLVERQVGVTGDDSSGGKVDALAHQVAAQPPLFALESRPDRLDGSSRFLQRLRLTGQVVVHVGRNVPLEELLKLVDDVRGRAFLFKLAERRVGANDLGELVRQVVLAAHRTAVDRDRRAHGRRRHRQDGQDHPRRVRLGRRQSHRDEVLVRDLAEEGMRLRRGPRLAVRLLGVSVLLTRAGGRGAQVGRGRGKHGSVQGEHHAKKDFLVPSRV